MYEFNGVNTDELPEYDDQELALDLLQQNHVLDAQGTSFNVPYKNRFRVTNLPDASTLKDVFGRIEELLTAYASAPSKSSGTVVEARQRFK
jgi:alanine-synthesizing transaminase